MFKQKKIGPRNFRCVCVGDDEKKRMCFRIIDSAHLKNFRKLGGWGNVVKSKIPNRIDITRPTYHAPILAKFIAYDYETNDGKGIYFKFIGWDRDVWQSSDLSIGSNQARGLH
jgi:hypothetical protein